MRRRNRSRKKADSHGELVSAKVGALRDWLSRVSPEVEGFLGKVGPIVGLVGGIAGVLGLCSSVKARRDQFEPRLVVSQIRFQGVWEPRTDPVAGLTRYAPRAATLSLRNVGLGEALDVRCYVVDPVSGRYQYFRFKEGFPLFCPGGAGLGLAPGKTKQRSLKTVRITPNEDATPELRAHREALRRK